MDDTSLGEINLEQIPKELRPNKHQHKSPWAIIIIVIIFIIFGLFWFTQSRTKIYIPSPVVTQSHQKSQTADLEAAVGAINISDYSSSL